MLFFCFLSVHLWNLGLSGAIDDPLDILRAGVAVTAELEAQGPVGRHHRSADDSGVLFDDVLRFGTHEDEKLQNAADGPVRQSGSRQCRHVCQKDQRSEIVINQWSTS